MIILIQKLNSDAIIPQKATEQAAGFDLYSIEDLVIEPGKTSLVRTGISIEIPRGYEGQVRPRSGLAAKNQITVLNAPGTIDSDYRGEVMAILINHGSSVFKVEKGMRIAQLVIQQVPHVVLMESDKPLSDTDRGKGGMGSTGLK